MTRVDEFIQDISFSQLVDEKLARKMGYNARTWTKAYEAGFTYRDQTGTYFLLTPAGRKRLNQIQDEKTSEFIGSFLKF